MNRTEKNDLKGYAFIRNQIVHTGVTPSLREICKVVGYGSPRSVQLMLERLKKRRLLSYVDGIIRLATKKNPLMTENTTNVPLVGSVACGLPSLAEQNIEAVIQISTKIARPGHSYFLLRAVGNSMNRSGINGGDLVLVKQQPVAEENEKVVVLIDDIATIKHIHHDGDVIILSPNSTDASIKPIVVTSELAIQGIVVATFPGSII